jgi:hypothetical protein
VTGIRNRLRALESAGRSGWRKVHRVLQQLGQDQDAALDDYGRDRIGPDDLVIVRRIVAPEGAG